VPVSALPVRIDTEPLTPLDAVPELNTSAPLMPTTPAFADRTVTAPLLVAVPDPLATSIAPPVLEAPTPPDTVTEPPI
jgi:hypothetical protein